MVNCARQPDSKNYLLRRVSGRCGY